MTHWHHIQKMLCTCHFFFAFCQFVVSLFAFLSLNSEVQPMCCKKVACTTVLPHLFIHCHTCKFSVIHHSGCCILTLEISVMEFIMPWRLFQLKLTLTLDSLTHQTFCFSPDVLASASKVPAMAVSVASDRGCFCQ